jgi:hypothetical protein
MLRVVEDGRAGGDEQLRYLVVIEILPDRSISRRAKAVEYKGDPLQLDQAAGLLDGLGRAVAVVETDEIDLAAVDAARFVDHPEICDLRSADHAIGGSCAAVGD